MDFLTGKNIYHGDLAARNVLLTDSLDTKIYVLFVTLISPIEFKNY